MVEPAIWFRLGRNISAWAFPKRNRGRAL